ncbi:MAG: indole-3-glycerol-phosphate synthase [Nitrospinae bacterium]|nr:indole-3-glycerol-phosphate synthase [Nitrospinota bacterium]
MTLHKTLFAILDHKREEVDAAKSIFPEEELLKAAGRRGKARSLYSAIMAGNGLRIIAEVKRSSPSVMLMASGFDPKSIAMAYESAGAAAISVLTDTRFFCGSPYFLPVIRDAVSIPVLRKDFIIDRWQVAESAALGADAMLLMTVNFGGISRLEDLYEYTLKLGMEPLLEIHSADEWDAIKHLRPKIVGINNRDFKSPNLEVDVAATLAVAPLIPKDVAVVSESGLTSNAELVKLSAAGARGFLIGSAFMRNPDPGAELAAMLA